MQKTRDTEGRVRYGRMMSITYGVKDPVGRGQEHERCVIITGTCCRAHVIDHNKGIRGVLHITYHKTTPAKGGTQGGRYVHVGHNCAGDMRWEQHHRTNAAGRIIISTIGERLEQNIHADNGTRAGITAAAVTATARVTVGTAGATAVTATAVTATVAKQTVIQTLLTAAAGATVVTATARGVTVGTAAAAPTTAAVAAVEAAPSRTTCAPRRTHAGVGVAAGSSGGDRCGTGDGVGRRPCRTAGGVAGGSSADRCGTGVGRRLPADDLHPVREFDLPHRPPRDIEHHRLLCHIQCAEALAVARQRWATTTQSHRPQHLPNGAPLAQRQRRRRRHGER